MDSEGLNCTTEEILLLLTTTSTNSVRTTKFEYWCYIYVILSTYRDLPTRQKAQYRPTPGYTLCHFPSPWRVSRLAVHDGGNGKHIFRRIHHRSAVKSGHSTATLEVFVAAYSIVCRTTLVRAPQFPHPFPSHSHPTDRTPTTLNLLSSTQFAPARMGSIKDKVSFFESFREVGSLSITRAESCTKQNTSPKKNVSPKPNASPKQNASARSNSEAIRKFVTVTEDLYPRKGMQIPDLQITEDVSVSSPPMDQMFAVMTFFHQEPQLNTSVSHEANGSVIKEKVSFYESIERACSSSSASSDHGKKSGDSHGSPSGSGKKSQDSDDVTFSSDGNEDTQSTVTHRSGHSETESDKSVSDDEYEPAFDTSNLIRVGDNWYYKDRSG
eukprot:1524193-Rhodomonas_salina.1